MSRARQAIKGTLWTSGATYVSAIVAFAGNLALARLLFPDDFGTYALASSVLTLVFVISGFGSQEAIIQCRDKRIQHLVPTAFWITIGLGIVLGLAGSMMGFLFMNRGDQLVGVLVIILSWVKFGRMIGNAYVATLIRDLRFRPMAYHFLFPTLVSFVVAVIFAALGFGIWSLLIRDLVDMVMKFVIAMRASDFQLGFEFDKAAAKWIWDFGYRSMFSRMGEVIFGKWDNLVVGALMGTSVLGHYSMAYRLAIIGSQLTQQPVAAISHSTYASAQSETAKLKLAFETAAYWLFRSAILLALLVWYTGAEVTVLLYGAKWSLAADTFRNMFIFVALLPFISNLKFFLIGSGNINRQLISQAIQILVFFPLLILAASRGNLIGVSWALNLTSVAVSLVMVYFVNQIVLMNWRYIFVRPMLVGLATAILIFLIQRSGEGLLLAEWQYVLLIVSLIGGIYLLFTFLIDGRTLRNELNFIRAHLA